MKDIRKSKYVLNAKITTIFTVSEWAQHMGYENKKKFTRHYRKHFQQNPKQMIIIEHLNNLNLLIEKYPKEKFLAIAWKAGFRDDNALREFVRRHTGLSLTKLKNIVLIQNKKSRKL